MKLALRNSILYFVGANLFFLVLTWLPDPVAFYLYLLFSMIHLVGISLVGLTGYATGTHEIVRAGPIAIFVVLIVLVNAVLVFGLTLASVHWARR